MKTFVLIMVIKYMGGGGITSTTVEFNNELSCLNAARAIVADLKEDDGRTVVLSYNCYPKE